MAREDLKPFKGNIETFKKVCVIEEGVITRMYWEHSQGNDEFSVADVVARWDQLHGKGNYDPIDQRFLSAHGFHRQNVIRDGVRLTV